jgi:lysophospholipase L1-like esterase
VTGIPSVDEPAGTRGPVGAHVALLAAVTAGLVGAAGAAAVSWAGLMRQARAATDAIEAAALAAGAASGALPEGAEFAWQAVPPSGDGVYLPGGAGPVQHVPDGALCLALLGDSTAVGYGCSSADELPGVVLARGLTAATGRPVHLTTHGVVGTGAADLARQVTAALPGAPDAAVIVVGSNDVRDQIPPRRSAAQLGQAVAALRAQGVPVVVGTCPDLGVIAPIPQPLRRVVGTWSRLLARMQAREVEAAGGVPVPIDRLVSPDFYGRPDLFYADGFHPSGPGYAKAVAALLPEVVAAVR